MTDKCGDLFRVKHELFPGRVAKQDPERGWVFDLEAMSVPPIGACMMLIHEDVIWYGRKLGSGIQAHIFLYDGRYYVYESTEIGQSFERVT